MLTLSICSYVRHSCSLTFITLSSFAVAFLLKRCISYFIIVFYRNILSCTFYYYFFIFFSEFFIFSLFSSQKRSSVNFCKNIFFVMHVSTACRLQTKLEILVKITFPSTLPTLCSRNFFLERVSRAAPAVNSK